jgi:hypothetical protein
MTREEILTATPERLNEYTCLEMGMVPGLPETADWNPAEDIRNAWELINHMHNKECFLTLIYQCGIFENDFDKMGYIATFRIVGRTGVWATGEAAPEAVCKAFLLATLPGN